MANVKISELTAASTPLAGTEVLPIVQSSATVKATIANVQTAVYPGGTANGVAYLNGSKVLTTGSALVFDGTNLGVGTGSPSSKIDAQGTAAGAYIGQLLTNNSTTGYVQHGFNIGPSGANGKAGIFYAPSLFYKFGVTANDTSTPITFVNNNDTERARIDSSGNLLVGTTSVISASVSGLTLRNNASGNLLSGVTSTASRDHLVFFNPNGAVGTISTSGSATSYVTSSDYRLKNTIAPMTGALAKVALLKPVTYKWNSNGSEGQGFIAHELQSVVPECVTGEKDGVDKNGKPVYQGIDTSFLVATLTAAIQELKAEFDAYKASHP